MVVLCGPLARNLILKTVMIQRHGGPEVLECVDVPLPVPEFGEILVRAYAFGVGRPDILARRGEYPWLPPLPFVIGNDLAGEVVSLGEGVDEHWLGEKVLISSRELPQRGGGYSDYVVVPSGLAFRLSAAICYDEAVCLSNYQLAWALLNDTVGARRPKTILVVSAAGGVGSALVQLAKLEGVRVIAVVGSAEKVRFVRQLGATDVINRCEEDIRERVRTLTAGRGVDLVLDPVGGPEFVTYLDVLAVWGRLVSYGVMAGLPTQDVFFALRRHLGKSLSVQCFSFHSYDEDIQERRSIMTKLIALLELGAIRPAIGAKFPLSQAREAHTLLESGTTLGRIVMSS